MAGDTEEGRKKFIQDIFPENIRPVFINRAFDAYRAGLIAGNVAKKSGENTAVIIYERNWSSLERPFLDGYESVMPGASPRLLFKNPVSDLKKPSCIVIFDYKAVPVPLPWYSVPLITFTSVSPDYLPAETIAVFDSSLFALAAEIAAFPVTKPFPELHSKLLF
jgi:hypothetical protein